MARGRRRSRARRTGSAGYLITVVAVLGAALVWVWPYAATWNSVREIGFRGATLCCGLLVVLCALRVYLRRAGLGTRLLLGLAAGTGWWASPEIGYFAVPAWLTARAAGCPARPGRALPGGLAAMLLSSAGPWRSLADAAAQAVTGDRPAHRKTER